jgi:hypothetical protein
LLRVQDCEELLRILLLELRPHVDFRADNHQATVLASGDSAFAELWEDQVGKEEVADHVDSDVAFVVLDHLPLPRVDASILNDCIEAAKAVDAFCESFDRIVAGVVELPYLEGAFGDVCGALDALLG